MEPWRMKEEIGGSWVRLRERDEIHREKRKKSERFISGYFCPKTTDFSRVFPIPANPTPP